jgi:UDP-N-acetylmuramate--alanine ligase
MPGTHNVQSCLAVIAVADELEVPLDLTKQALATFGGVGRRFSIVGEVRGVTLVDDYGHHPAEIEATLDAAQRAYNRRIVVAFQPHRYTRTRDLFDEFTRAFNRADVVIVTDIYAAGERPIAGVSAAHLAQAIREHGHHDVTYVADKRHVPDELERRVEAGDVVIALGAGDINGAVRELHDRLTREGGAR